MGREVPQGALSVHQTRFFLTQRAMSHQFHGVFPVSDTGHSPGCDHCSHTGHKGRLGLHELMMVNADTRRLIQTGEMAALYKKWFHSDQGTLPMSVFMREALKRPSDVGVEQIAF